MRCREAPWLCGYTTPPRQLPSTGSVPYLTAGPRVTPDVWTSPTPWPTIPACTRSAPTAATPARASAPGSFLVLARLSTLARSIVPGPTQSNAIKGNQTQSIRGPIAASPALRNSPKSENAEKRKIIRRRQFSPLASRCRPIRCTAPRPIRAHRAPLPIAANLRISCENARTWLDRGLPSSPFIQYNIAILLRREHQ